jgi:hypothetical protein
MTLIHKSVSPFGDWIIFMNGVPLYKKWPNGRSVLFDKYGPPISNTDRDSMPHGDPEATPTEPSAMGHVATQEPSPFVKMVVDLLSSRSSDAAFIDRTTRLFVAAADLLNWKDFANHEVFTLNNLRDNLDMGALIEALNFSKYPDIPCEVHLPVSDYLKSIPGYRPDLGLQQSKEVIRWHGASEYEITKVLAALDENDRDALKQPLAVADDVYPDGGANWIKYLLDASSSSDQVQQADELVPTLASSRQAAVAANPFTQSDPDTLARMISGLLADTTSDVELVARATNLLVVANNALHWKQDERLEQYGIPELRDHLNLKAVIDLADPAVYPAMPVAIRKPIQEYLRTLHDFRPEMGCKQTQTTLDEHGMAEMQLTKLLGSLYDRYSYLFDGSAIEDPHLSDPFWIPKRLGQLEEARASHRIPEDIMKTASQLDHPRGGPSSLDIAEAIHAERMRWQAEIEHLRKAADYISPYLLYTVGDESPGHHPTMPSAVAAFHVAFDIDTQVKRIARIRSALKGSQD